MAKDILGIRFHGRGGQGAKTAANLVAETALEQGRQVQAFPEYGPERMGAPVRSFLRISDKPVKTYAPLMHPDIVVIIDPTLTAAVDVTEGIEKGGIIIINSHKKISDIREDLKGFKGTIVAVDGTSLSLKHLKKNVPNVPLLGALVKKTGIVELKTLKKAIRQHFLHKLGEEKTKANIDMLQEAYDSV